MKTLKLIYYTCSIIFMLIFSACNKENEQVHIKEGKTKMNVSVGIQDYATDNTTITPKMASAVGLDQNKPVLDTTIVLNKDYILKAQLKPSTDNSINLVSSNRNSTNLGSSIYYKLIVYKTNGGDYVTERLYKRQFESQTDPLLLDGGINYTIVAISLNSTADSSALNNSFSGSNLATATFSVTGDPDLLFSKQTLVVTGEASQDLIINFKHKFSQITAIINSTLTGYYAQNPLDIKLKTSKNTAELTFATEAVTKSGTSKTTNLTFPNENLQSTFNASSTPQAFNAVSGNNSLVLSQITIGEVTEKNKEIQLDAVLLEGYKYNLVLTISPQDKFLNWQGQSAALINGKIWMRHNLGATTSLDPDQIPSVQGLNGNYYQWGRNTVVATAATSEYSIAGWNNSINFPPNLWNSGTEDQPIKQINNDPCPANYRMPTTTEFRELLDATIPTNAGAQFPLNHDFTEVKVLASKRNAAVKLTFPKAGNRNFNDGSLSFGSRSTVGYYWSSSAPTGIEYQNANLVVNSTQARLGANTVSWGFSVRCIAIDNN